MASSKPTRDTEDDGIRGRLRTNPRKTMKYITMQEVLSECRKSVNLRNVVILPPDTGDQGVDSDEEITPDLDNDYPTEVAGEVELEFTDSSDDSSDEQDRTLTDPKWRKHTTFHEELPDMPCPNITQSHPELETMSE